MAKPSNLFSWATTGGTTVEPSSGQKAAGFAVGEKPPARWFNWLFNGASQWHAYLNNLHNESEFLNKAYTWVGDHTWGGLGNFRFDNLLSVQSLESDSSIEAASGNITAQSGAVIASGNVQSTGGYVKGTRFYFDPVSQNNRYWPASLGRQLSAGGAYATVNYHKMSFTGSGTSGTFGWVVNGKLPADVSLAKATLYYTLASGGTGGHSLSLAEYDEHGDFVAYHGPTGPGSSVALTSGIDTSKLLTLTPAITFTPESLKTFSFEIVSAPAAADLEIHGLYVEYNIGVIWPG